MKTPETITDMKLIDALDEAAKSLGVDTGSIEVHCRDGQAGEVKVHKTIKLQRKPKAY